MTEPTDRPDDQQRTSGSQPHDDGAGRDEQRPESVLSGFSWDDPSGAQPTRPEEQASASHGTGEHGAEQAAGEHSGSSAYDGRTPGQDTPAQYPPAAPYPPVGAEVDDAAAAAFGEQPTGQPTYGQPGWGQPDQEAHSGRPSSAQPSYGEQQPYGQQPYGQPTGGYGQSAEYTSTPQPYAYGPPPMSPDGEKARSNAILWTILNVVAIFLCNLLAIVGAILAGLAIGKAREDVQGARNLTKWSWILFAAGFALAILFIVGVIALGFASALGTAGMSSEF